MIQAIVRMRKRITTFTVTVILLTQLSTGESCESCPSGMFVKRSCTESVPTVCEPCSIGTFTDAPNYHTGCFPHRQCAERSHETILSPGTSTHDVVCQCQEGYHREDVDCVRNPYCPLGEGVIPTGDKCEKCQNGTYSDKISNLEACVPWTNCSEHGERVISEGTTERDVVCTGHIGAVGDNAAIARTALPELKGTIANREVTVSVSKTLEVGIIVAAASSILTSVGISILVARKCRKPGRKPHQEERTQFCDNTNEEGISNEDNTRVKDTEVHAAVECQEDSFPTHPKMKEAFSAVDDCGDSQRLLHPSSQADLVSSGDRLEPHSSSIVTASNPIEDDEMLADEIFQPRSSSAIDIPQATSGNDESSPVASTIASSRQTTDSSLADREEGRNLVLGVYSNVVTNRVMDQLASELGDNWKDLAPLLDVKQHQVDRILNEHKGNIREQVFAMLRNWQQGKTGEATLSDLYEPLLECNRGEVFSRLLALKDPVT